MPRSRSQKGRSGKRKTEQFDGVVHVCTVHKDLTDKINLCDVANEFVSSSEHRQQVFGKF